MPELLTRTGNCVPRLAPSTAGPWGPHIIEFANPGQQRAIPQLFTKPRSYESPGTTFNTISFFPCTEPLSLFESTIPETFEQALYGYRSLVLLGQIKDLLSEGEIVKALRMLVEEKASGNKLSEPLQRLSDTLDKQSVVRKPVTTLPRTTEATWIKKNWDAYKGKWVAVLGDQAVASGTTLRELLEAVKEKQLSERPIIHHIK